MKKQRIDIVHELNSSSPAIIWKLIGTAEGLRLWIADEVTFDNGIVTLRWGEGAQSHSQQAEIVESVKQSHLRMRWVDEEDPEAYLEMRMEYNELTEDYMLLITDYTMPEDVSSLYDIWADNLHRLHHSSGL